MSDIKLLYLLVDRMREKKCLQEALSILHRNGANNANIPAVLEADLAPIVVSETDDTGRQKKQVTDAHSKDGLFDKPADPDAPWRP